MKLWPDAHFFHSLLESGNIQNIAACHFFTAVHSERNYYLQNWYFNALSFYRSQNILCWSKYFEPAKKIWLHLVPLQKVLCRHKKQFYWMQIIFLSGRNCLWLLQYVNKFLVWHKKFRPAQNILGPVKGKGISFSNISFSIWGINYGLFLTKHYYIIWFCQTMETVDRSYYWKLQNSNWRKYFYLLFLSLIKTTVF